MKPNSQLILTDENLLSRVQAVRDAAQPPIVFLGEKSETLPPGWINPPGVTVSDVLKDVIEMVHLLQAQQMYGPYYMIVPESWLKMSREEIWVTFAMGAAGQFPTARLAAAHADELMAEFDTRFPDYGKDRWHADEEPAGSTGGHNRESDRSTEADGSGGASGSAESPSLADPASNE